MPLTSETIMNTMKTLRIRDRAFVVWAPMYFARQSEASASISMKKSGSPDIIYALYTRIGRKRECCSLVHARVCFFLFFLFRFSPLDSTRIHPKDYHTADQIMADTLEATLPEHGYHDFSYTYTDDCIDATSRNFSALSEDPTKLFDIDLEKFAEHLASSVKDENGREENVLAIRVRKAMKTSLSPHICIYMCHFSFVPAVLLNTTKVKELQAPSGGRIHL